MTTVDHAGKRRPQVEDTSISVALHAKAVNSAIFSALCNAMNEPEREEYWRKHADMLERKFITDYGKHYFYFLDTTNLV